MTQNGGTNVFDLPFLAMAHQRLGHFAQARAAREKFESMNWRSWSGEGRLLLDLLSREVQECLSESPDLPLDPFAH